MMSLLNHIPVITTQLGYRPHHGRKRVLMPDIPEVRTIFGAAIYMIFEQNRFSMELLNSPTQTEYILRDNLHPVRTDFGKWLVGDFSAVTNPGVYQIYCAGMPSVTFAMREDVWVRIIPDLIRYFQVQSCGRNVPGWHEACHLDDGYCPETEQFVSAAGGWHDAGDFRKWVSSTAMIPISLLVAHRLWAGKEERLGLYPGTLLHEALQGLHYFLGMQDPVSGMLYNNVGGGRYSFHDNSDNRYTDNIAQSGDERRINMTPANTPAKYSLLFALYADALCTADPVLSTRCLQAALNAAKYDASTQDYNADALQWRAWAFLEIWRCSGEEEHKRVALQSLSSLLALQVTDYIGGQQVTRGFFRAHADQPGYHHKHIGADYPIWVLAEFIEAFPTHPENHRWREALALWVDDYVCVFVERNPFGLVPYSMYPAVSATHIGCLYRELGPGLFYRYFMAGNPFGVNARSSLTAAALAAAVRILGRPELLDHAYRMLEWIVGANPFQLSTVTGVGVFQPCALSFQMGNIPGGVTMGIGGDDQDQPSYHNGAHPWLCCDEYYGYQTSQFLWAITALEALSYTK